MLVTRLASPSRAVARARPTERMTRPRRHFWSGKDVLDRDPHPRPADVTAGEVRRHRLAARLRSLELRCQSPARQQRRGLPPSGRRCRPRPNWPCSAVEQRAELAAIVLGRVSHREVADEAMLAIDTEMVLVTEDRDHELGARSGLASALAAALDGPAAVDIHLRPLRLRPTFGYGAALDGRLLAPAEPGPARLDDGGVHDLPAHRQIAGVPQHRIEALEQALHGPGAAQLLAEQPDGLGIRHPILERKTQEPHEREPVPDLVLGLVVRERVERLQHQHLEHQHCVVRRPATLRPLRPIECRLEFTANSSKSTTDSHRWSGSPAADSDAYRSSRSKNPGCPDHAPSPPQHVGENHV